MDQTLNSTMKNRIRRMGRRIVDTDYYLCARAIETHFGNALKTSHLYKTLREAFFFQKDSTIS